MAGEELLSILEQFGIKFDKIDEKTDLHAAGYRPIESGDGVLGTAGKLFEWVPTLFSTAGAVRGKGLYYAKVPAGMHLGESHITEGAKSALLYDEKGHLKGPAQLFNNPDKLLNITQCAFNLASYATGKYFEKQKTTP